LRINVGRRRAHQPVAVTFALAVTKPITQPHAQPVARAVTDAGRADMGRDVGELHGTAVCP
jgi:hypothetical protein